MAKKLAYLKNIEDLNIFVAVITMQVKLGLTVFAFQTRGFCAVAEAIHLQVIYFKTKCLPT